MAPLRSDRRKGAIMRPTKFPAEAITALLRKQKVATIQELKGCGSFPLVINAFAFSGLGLMRCR